MFGMQFLLEQPCYVAIAEAGGGDLMRSESAFLDTDEKGDPAFVETRTGRHKTMSLTDAQASIPAYGGTCQRSAWR